MAFLQSQWWTDTPPLWECVWICVRVPVELVGWESIIWLSKELSEISNWEEKDILFFLFDKKLIQSKQTCMTLTLQGSHPSNVYKPHSQYQYPPSSPSTDFIPTPFPPPKNCRESQLHQPNVPFRVFWARFLAVDLRVEHKCFQERG